MKRFMTHAFVAVLLVAAGIAGGVLTQESGICDEYLKRLRVVVARVVADREPMAPPAAVRPDPQPVPVSDAERKREQRRTALRETIVKATSERRSTLARLNERFIELRSVVSRLGPDGARRDARAGELADEVTQLNEKLAELEQQIESASIELESNSNEPGRASAKILPGPLESIRAEQVMDVAQAANTIDSLTRQVEGLRKDLDVARAEGTAARREVERANHEAELQKTGQLAQLDAAQKAQAEAERREKLAAERLAVSEAALRTARQSVEEANGKLSDRVAEAVRQRTDAEREARSLAATVQKLDADKREVETQRNRVLAERDALQRKQAATEQRLATVQTKLNDAYRRIEQFDAAASAARQPTFNGRAPRVGFSIGFGRRR
jgi:chromosome segregation ATPase